MKSVRELFPRCSESFASINPQVNGGDSKENVVQTNPQSGKGQRRGHLNSIEREFSMILQAQKQRGDILRYEFEGITLRFASVRYTPDFIVFPPATAVSGQVKLIEVKGAFTKGKFERAVERFRHARTYYGDVFLFELHQKTRQGWRRIL
jgi:hypothetical protein